jgi:copper chaperone CopZ
MVNGSDYKEIRFSVTDITCFNCALRVKRALATLRNVEGVEVIPDFERNMATAIIKVKGSLERREIEEVIEEASMETPHHEYKVIWD